MPLPPRSTARLVFPALLLAGPLLAQEEPPAEGGEVGEQEAGEQEAGPDEVCQPGEPVPLPEGLQASDVPSGSIRRAETTMGTTVALGASRVPCEEATAAFAEVFEEFHRIEVMAGSSHEDSGVRQINEAAGGEPVPVSGELFALIERALAFAEKTDGAFDPTFAAMDGLWRFDAPEPPAAVQPAEPPAAPPPGLAGDGDGAAAAPVVADVPPAPPPTRAPSGAEVEKRRGLVNYRKVELDPDNKTVRLAEPGMRLSLGGIRKGYATDRAVEILRRRGVPHFIIRAGNDMYIEGDPGGGGRRIGIPDPRAEGAFALVEVKDRAFNISSDADRFFIEGGVRYHHIIDPRTGYPAHHARTVALIAEDATTADALSTAVFVLGPERGLQLVEEQEGAEALIVGADNQLHVSSGFGPRLLVMPATDKSP